MVKWQRNINITNFPPAWVPQAGGKGRGESYTLFRTLPKRRIIVVKNILIALADTIRMSADAIRMSADILIVFLPILIILKKQAHTNIKRQQRTPQPKAFQQGSGLS